MPLDPLSLLAGAGLGGSKTQVTQQATQTTAIAFTPSISVGGPATATGAPAYGTPTVSASQEWREALPGGFSIPSGIVSENPLAQQGQPTVQAAGIAGLDLKTILIFGGIGLLIYYMMQ